MEALDLIKKARKYEKQGKPDKFDLKIAVLGSYSIQHFVSGLRYYLHTLGFEADIYEGEYDGIALEVLDENSAIYDFRPNVVIILPYYEDIKVFPGLFDTDAEVNQKVQEQVSLYANLWESLAKRIEGCRILQSNIVMPYISQLGNLENSMETSKTSFYKKINDYMWTQSPADVCVLDFDGLACNIGKRYWFDYPSYYLSKTGFSLNCLPEVIDLTSRTILALMGFTKKCLVLDLDNTLWGGVVGDDGYDGIQLDPNNAVGEAYRAFQKYLLDLKQRGIILAVCSKNDEEIAKAPFLHNENMVLKLDDISCFIANWDDKASNIRAIAQRLNIGLDSLVFFDDNPAEREIVKRFVPEVMVINVPDDPANYASVLSESRAFEWMQITQEDLSRSETYVSNQKREKMISSFVNYEDYLQALEMTGIVDKVDEGNIGRFSQLINKSNQFNLRTQRYTESDISSMLESEDYTCLYVKLKDKFSNYGLISCCILKFNHNDCFIDTWVMSCRVLKRGVEHLLFNQILNEAEQKGADCIRAEWIRTNKNAMVSNLYDSLGFELISEDYEKKQYRISLPAESRQHFIKVNGGVNNER